MKFKDSVIHSHQGLVHEGPFSEVVISSRVRLARNLEDFPFTNCSGKEEKERVLSLVQEAVRRSKYLKNSQMIFLDQVDQIDRQYLVEKHLISPDLAQSPSQTAVVLSEMGIISMMINEEDHLRIQSIQPGLQLMESWRMVEQVDEDLEEFIPPAFSPLWGYLTACPTNVGTGMRASVMLHLPGLVMAKEMAKVLEAIASLHLTSRGFYGEGTRSFGNFFQISNQITLGQSEEEIIENLECIAKKIVDYEVSARDLLWRKRRRELEDRIWRSYGILSNARVISSREALNHLSTLRLGVFLGIVRGIKKGVINSLFTLIQPAHIQMMEGKALAPLQRDVLRADFIRERIKEVKITN